MGPLLLAAALAVYNAVANRWRPFHGPAYVPVNLVTTAAIIAAGIGLFDLSSAEIGLSASGLGTGMLIGASVALPFLLLLGSSRMRILLRDRRLNSVRSTPAALFLIFIRIPLGTAVLEEIAFRGVLLGTWRSAGTASAIIGSSIAFGVWHVVPTQHLVRTNRPGRPVGAAVVGGVLVTALAGAGLAYLRVELGGIAAPLAAHALVSSIAASAALLARAVNGPRLPA